MRRVQVPSTGSRDRDDDDERGRYIYEYPIRDKPGEKTRWKRVQDSEAGVEPDIETDRLASCSLDSARVSNTARNCSNKGAVQTVKLPPLEMVAAAKIIWLKAKLTDAVVATTAKDQIMGIRDDL